VVATADGVKAALPQLKTALPAGIKLIRPVRPDANRARLRFRCAIHADVDGAAGCNRYLFFSCGHFVRPIIPGVALPLSLIVTLGVMSLLRIQFWIIYP